MGTPLNGNGSNGKTLVQRIAYTLTVAGLTGLATWLGHSAVDSTRMADKVESLERASTDIKATTDAHTAKINNIETKVTGIEHDQAAAQRSLDKIDQKLDHVLEHDGVER